MINFKKMYIYKLLRTKELDHENGRPAIFLDFLGNESLVWFGTSIKSELSEQPFTIKINNTNTYFYNKGLTKVNTKKLIDKWRNHKTNKIIMLSDLQQKQLIAKFSTLTLQPNPYLTINDLKVNNEDLIIKTNNIIKLLDNYDFKIKTLETKVEKLEQQIKKEQLTHGQ